MSRIQYICNYIFTRKDRKGIRQDDMVQGSLPSNLNLHASSQSTKTDYRTFDKSNSAVAQANETRDDSHAHHSHQDNSAKYTNGRKIALRDFFTVLALSFHAVFEGLAIGLEKDSADMWILFAGLCPCT